MIYFQLLDEQTDISSCWVQPFDDVSVEKELEDLLDDANSKDIQEAELLSKIDNLTLDGA